MADKIECLSLSDYEELIAHLDAAFQFSPEASFTRLVPLVYRPTEELMRCNFAIRREGRIAAVVGVFPVTWHLGRAVLRVAGVGGVSCASPYRGQGLMSRLLAHAREHIRREGYHLSYLGGQRQRYAHFGWEKAGMEMRFAVSEANVRHHFANRPSQGIHLEPLDPADKGTILELKALHDAQVSWCQHSAEDFELYLRSWITTPKVARDAQGRIVGYALIGRGGKAVAELVARNEEMICEVIRCLMEDRAASDPLGIVVDVLDSPAARAIGAFANDTAIHLGGNWQIFDWPHVLGAALAAKHQTASLPQGEVILGIDGCDQALRLRVNADGPGCEYTDEEPGVLAGPLVATRLLFGPLEPASVVPLPARASILNAWCPLPLRLSRQDHV